MGSFTPGPPIELTLGLKNIFNVQSFVETGTYIGSTAAWASDHFRTVTTIEASPKLFEFGTAKLKGCKNVERRLGNSAAELFEIVPRLEKSIFWLDAHWSGDITAGEGDECPLLAELAAITPWMQKHVIMIDDARLFLGPPPAPHVATEWPSLDEICKIANLTVQVYTFVYNDVIVIVPAYSKPLVVDMLRNISA